MSYRYAANLSMLYQEVAFLDRFGRAAGDGFRAVEFLFPYEAGVGEVQARIDDLGLIVALFNAPPGDLDAGEWGTLGVPPRRDHFRRAFATALDAADRLRCRRVHTLFGNRVPELDPEAQVACAVDNLAWAAPQAAEAGITLVLEWLNPVDFARFFLHSTAAAMAVIRQIDHPAVKLQYDVYHAQTAEGNLIHTIEAHLPYLGHVQVADVPGRHEPGTGEINYPAVLGALDRLGYDGYVGLEYRPSGATSASLGWLPRELRGRR